MSMTLTRIFAARTLQASRSALSLAPPPVFQYFCPRLYSSSAPFRNMEAAFQSACESRTIAGTVLLASDRSGRLDYRRVFGVRSLENPEAKEPLALDTTVWFASCTKLITAIAALQCVERGLVALDEDTRSRLPELQQVDIVYSKSDGDMSHTTPNTAPVTLRHLLSHSSGYCYEYNSPALQQWRREQPGEMLEANSIPNRFMHPLIFEPGTKWSYGPSIDWAGLLLERVTGQSLQDYCEQHIWSPLGIKDLTFFLSTRPDLQARRGRMTSRPDEDAPEAEHAERQPCFEPDALDCQGGGGVFGSPTEYIKILRAVLRATGPDASDEQSYPAEQLLRRSTAELLFEPQLSPGGKAALQAVADIPRYNEMLNGLPAKTEKDWAFGGLLVMEDLLGWRRKGTVGWGGKPNLVWWIDRTAGLCGLYASQLLPMGDRKTNELTRLFEKDMYARLAALEGEGEPAVA